MKEDNGLKFPPFFWVTRGLKYAYFGAKWRGIEGLNFKICWQEKIFNFNPLNSPPFCAENTRILTPINSKMAGF